MADKCLLMVNSTVSIFEYDVLQIKSGYTDQWEDYSTIRTTEEAMIAHKNVLNGQGRYRVVNARKQVTYNPWQTMADC